MQMIDGNDSNDGAFETQASWASDLNTTSNGTWIKDITDQINLKTTWDETGAGKFA